MVRAAGDLQGRLQDGADVGHESPFALRVVDDDGLGRVVGRGVLHAVQRHRRVARVVVGLVARMQGAVPGGFGFVAEFALDERQVVVGGEVLRIDGERLLEPYRRLAQALFPLGLALRGTVHLRALVHGLAHLVQCRVVLAEIEAALARVGEIRGEHFAILADGFVQAAVLLVDDTREPRDRPRVGRHLGLGGALECRGRVVQAPLADVDARQVHRTFAAAELLHFTERLLRLAQFAAPALAE